MAKNKYQNKKQRQEARQAEEARLIAAGLMEAPKSKKQLAEEERLARVEANKAAEPAVTPAKKTVEQPIVKKSASSNSKPVVKVKQAVSKSRKKGRHADIYETNFGGKYRLLRWISISIVLGLVATLFIGVTAGTINQSSTLAPSEQQPFPVEQPLVPSLGTSETIEVTTPPEPTP